jgi:hypothetical protein
MSELHTMVEEEMKLFHDAVVDRYQETQSWIDAIVQHCESIGVEVEDCIGMVSPSIVAKLQIEGQAKRMLKMDAHVRLEL